MWIYNVNELARGTPNELTVFELIRHIPVLIRVNFALESRIMYRVIWNER